VRENQRREGNLWVDAALNGGRSLGGVEGDDDDKLCEGNSNPVGGCSVLNEMKLKP